MAAICYESPLKLTSTSQHRFSSSTKPNLFSLPTTFRCNFSNSSSSKTLIATEPQPQFTFVKAFALATVANLSLGFDFLGCIGDFITLRIDPLVHPGGISIFDITSLGNSSNKLSKNPLYNCARIAAIFILKMLNVQSVGLTISLEMGLPLGSGSSAASVAAAALAVNEIFGGKLSLSNLVNTRLKSESKVLGYHMDNMAPSIIGGFVLIKSYDPLKLMRLKFSVEKDLLFMFVSPEFGAPTKKMRAALPPEITMSYHVSNCSQAGALVASHSEPIQEMVEKYINGDDDDDDDYDIT